MREGWRHRLRWLPQWAPAIAVVLSVLGGMLYLGGGLRLNEFRGDLGRLNEGQRRVDNRLDAVDARFDAMTARMESLFAELRTELRGELAGLRTELRDELAGLRTELRDDRRGTRVELSKVQDDVAAVQDAVVAVRERVAVLEAAQES